MSSLTQLLQGDTALRRWFEVEFPQAADRLQPSPPLRRVVPLRHPWHVPPWLIGMAFDWRLRLGLERPRAEGSTAEAGWWHLEAVVTESRRSDDPAYLGPSPTPVHHLMAVATQARGDAGRPRDEAALARTALSLAAYENCYRQGVAPDEPLVDVRSDAAVDRMLTAWDASAVDDVVRLTAAARGGLRELFPARGWT